MRLLCGSVECFYTDGKFLVKFEVEEILRMGGLVVRVVDSRDSFYSEKDKFALSYNEHNPREKGKLVYMKVRFRKTQDLRSFRT